jgi:hypothetical protein
LRVAALVPGYIRQMLFRLLLLTSLAGALVGAAGCGGCDGGGFPSDAFSPDALVQTGTVSLAFTLTDKANAPVTCDQIGANTVFLQLKSRTSASGAAVSLSCATGGGMSQPIPVGTYDVSIDLNGAINGVAATLASGAPQNGVVVKVGANTMLDAATFAVNATGGLVLSLVAPLETSNCKQSGAGITTTTITLVHTGDGCAPVTFSRSRGTTTLSPYTVNCSSPAITTCVESDEQLAVSNLVSGSYTIHVRGQINGIDCWTNDDILRVPLNDQNQTQTLNLAFDSRCRNL